AAPTAVRTLTLKQGRLLKVVAHRAGLALDGDAGIVGVRVTLGAQRLCAQFGGASVAKDEPGLFKGKHAPASALADCSDEALGTAPPIGPGFDDPGCPDPFPLPPAEPPPPGSATGAFHRVTLDDPLAVCNDGSPARLFVRPAPPNGAHARDWVVWLQGGASCI